MKINNRLFAIAASACLGLALACAAMPTWAAASAKVVAQCTGCHGAQLTGTGMAPGITKSGTLKKYTKATFERLMKSGIGANGKPTKPSMPTYHQSAAQADAIFAYLKTLK